MRSTFLRVFRPCLIAIVLLCTASARGDEGAAQDALKLADNTEFAAVKDKTLSTMLEASGIMNENTSGVSQRVSLDTRWDTPLAGQGWRLVLSNRFDSRFYQGSIHSRGVNTLREAYLSYQLAPRTLLDAGRVNIRYGVALGYNPTDVLGNGTVRSAISVDPEILRNNRQGNVMVRLQQFLDNASITTIVSPKLGGDPSDNGTSLDWGASNPRDRLLLVGSYRFAENINPQVLYFQESHRSPQGGVNLSRVLSRSMLVYLEYAGGRQPLSWQYVLPENQQDLAWRNRAAAGVTWTGDSHLTLRFEGHYNGSADNKRAMSFLSSIPIYGTRKIDASPQQSADWMSSRRSVLVQAYWKDIIDQYDLNLIWQRDLQQQKNMVFSELRHHIGSADVAMQWQKIYAVETETEYRIHPEQRWQLSASYYF